MTKCPDCPHPQSEHNEREGCTHRREDRIVCGCTRCFN